MIIAFWSQACKTTLKRGENSYLWRWNHIWAIEFLIERVVLLCAKLETIRKIYKLWQKLNLE